MDETLFDPIAQYPSLANAIKANSESYFETLRKEAGVDAKENEKTVGSYYKLLAQIETKKKHRNSLRVWRVFFYIFAGLSFLASILFLIFIFTIPELSWWISIFLLIFFALLGAFFIIAALKILTPKIRNFLDQLNVMQDQANTLLEEAKNQMAPLNERYDWNSQVDIIKKTVPILSLDKNFDRKKQDMFLHRFHYEENNEDYSSVYFAQTGTIRDNPFIIERDYIVSMIDQVYSGATTITWTTTRTNKDGSTERINHEQTLTASVTRPRPVYGYNTYLFYGNDSCPNLSFLRKPTHLDNPTPQVLAKFIKGRKKELKEKAKSSLLKSSSSAFTTLGDEDFDALFGATDRNNEVEFRLLFTPLAEQGMSNLITKSPFGDDFSFSKSGVLNLVRSEHLETSNIYANPAQFANFDLALAKRNFIDYQCHYFKDLYFAIAPVLAIPEYENNKPTGFTYSEEKTNLTDTEEEVLANSFIASTFSHPSSATNTILKSEFIAMAGPFDLTEISAYSYGAKHLSQTFTLKGGDGHYHDVVVPYIEYYPLVEKTNLYLIYLGLSRYEYNHSFLLSPQGEWIRKKALPGASLSFQRGILAFIPKQVFSEDDIKEYLALSTSSVEK